MTLAQEGEDAGRILGAGAEGGTSTVGETNGVLGSWF
jgi:hypothetical protein